MFLGFVDRDKSSGVDRAGVLREAWFENRTAGFFDPPIESIFGPDTQNWRARNRRAAHVEKLKEGFQKYARKPEHIKVVVHHPAWAKRLREGESIAKIMKDEYFEGTEDKTEKQYAKFVDDMKKREPHAYCGDHSRQALLELHQQYPSEKFYKRAEKVRYVIIDYNNADEVGRLREMSVIENKISSLTEAQDFYDNVSIIHRELEEKKALGEGNVREGTINKASYCEQFGCTKNAIGGMICIAKTFGEEWAYCEKIMLGDIKPMVKEGSAKKAGKKDKGKRGLTSTYFYCPFSSDIPRSVRCNILKQFVNGEISNKIMAEKCANFKAATVVNGWVIEYLKTQSTTSSPNPEIIKDVQYRARINTWDDVISKYPGLGTQSFIEPYYICVANDKSSKQMKMPANLKTDIDKYLARHENQLRLAGQVLALDIKLILIVGL